MERRPDPASGPAPGPAPEPAPAPPCPSWCRGGHAETDHAEDRHHQSPPELVAVVTGRPALEADDRARAASVVLRLLRRDGSTQTWLEVVGEEDADVRLVATAESARRLVEAADRLLARVRS